jgi:hypothetical protein
MTTVENSIEASQKLKMNCHMIQQYLSQEYTQRNVSQVQQRHLHTHVYCSIIHNSRAMKTAKMPHY